MAAEVGLDARDVHWVSDPKVKPIELFVGGRIDAFLGFPPEPQQLRAAHVGHVLVNTAVDRPWSQYFCCMLAGSPDSTSLSLAVYAARRTMPNGPVFFRVCPDRRVIEPA